jgi:DUF1009 family protein
MKKAGASCLALDSGCCLMLDREAIIAAADEAGITIVAEAHSVPNHLPI